MGRGGKDVGGYCKVGVKNFVAIFCWVGSMYFVFVPIV